LRSVRVLRNIVSNYLRFFVTGLLGFVVTPILVLWMGDGDYGLWVAVFSLTGYFGLFDQGIRPSLVRYVSRDHTRGDMDGLSRTLSSALGLYTSVGFLVMVATFAVSAYFTRWFQVEPAQMGHAGTVVLLAGASVALGFPMGVFGAALSGLQRYDVANGIGIVVSVLRVAAFVIVLRLGYGIVGLAWSSLAMNLLGHCWSWIAARRLLGPEVRFSPRMVDRAHMRLIGAYSSIAFFGALANNIAFQTDALVITAFMGAASVTPFALGAGLVDNVRTLVHSATWVLAPTASELETRGEHAKLHDMMMAGAKYSVLISWPVLFGLVIFGSNFLTTWVSADYAWAGRLLTILAIPTLIALPQSAAGSVLFGISRHKGVVALAVLNAALNLGLSLWWVKPFGLYGVAYGTAVPLTLVGGVATMIYGCHALRLPLGRYLWEGMGRPGLASLAFVVPALIGQALFHPIGWGPLAAVTGGSWLIFAVFAWRWAVTPEERTRWARMVPGLLGNRGTAAAEIGR